MNESVKHQFGKRLHQIRISQNLSQEKLAELANLHRTYISDVERGERNISIEAIEKIAKALKIELSELFNGIKINE